MGKTVIVSAVRTPFGKLGGSVSGLKAAELGGKAIPGVRLIEMDRNRENGMCCGAGGGLMWTEETTGQRINVARTEQALAVNPGIISSGCPYCLTMLSDGTKAKEVEEKVHTYDVAELLEKSIYGDVQEQVS